MKEYRVHTLIPVILIIASALGIILSVYIGIWRAESVEDMAVMLLCVVAPLYLLYRGVAQWNTRIVVDDNSIKFRGITIPFSAITSIRAQDPLVINFSARRVLYGKSVYYTIESSDNKIEFISGWFPKHEEIIENVTQGSGVQLQKLDALGNTKLEI